MTRAQWDATHNPAKRPVIPPQDPVINMTLNRALDRYLSVNDRERRRLRPLMLLKIKKTAREAPAQLRALAGKLRDAGLD